VPQAMSTHLANFREQRSVPVSETIVNTKFKSVKYTLLKLYRVQIECVALKYMKMLMV